LTDLGFVSDENEGESYQDLGSIPRRSFSFDPNVVFASLFFWVLQLSGFCFPSILQVSGNDSRDLICFVLFTITIYS
jgi:hypothetical protein